MKRECFWRLIVRDRTNMEHEIIKEISMVGREIRFGFINYVNARVEDGPTPIEGMTLSFLAEHPNAEAKDVGEKFKINKSTVSGVLHSLESRGYITSERSPSDGRRKTIVVTEKGLAHRNRVHDIGDAYDSILVKDLTEEEIQTLIKALEKVRNGIKEALEDGTK